MRIRLILIVAFGSTFNCNFPQVPSAGANATEVQGKDSLTKLRKDFDAFKKASDEKPSAWLTFIIGLIGSGIGLGSLAWNIIAYFKQNMSKYSIEYNFSAVVMGNRVMGYTEPELVLSFTITNISKSDRFIKKPYLALPYEVEYLGFKGKEISILNTDSFPKCLKPGEQFKGNFPLKENTLMYIKPSLTKWFCRLAVQDTLKKKSYSKRIRLSLLKSHCEANISHQKKTK